MKTNYQIVKDEFYSKNGTLIDLKKYFNFNVIDDNKFTLDRIDSKQTSIIKIIIKTEKIDFDQDYDNICMEVYSERPYKEYKVYNIKEILILLNHLLLNFSK